jgi:hypothetical protein
MAPKPVSTAGKAPASTASKAPAKPSEGAKAAKKTSKAAAAAPGEPGEKKKRKKARKETYSSYIYKGSFISPSLVGRHLTEIGSPEAGSPRYGYLQQGDGHSE